MPLGLNGALDNTELCNRTERIEEELRERESEMREMEENEKMEMVEKVTSWREETERHLR